MSELRKLAEAAIYSEDQSTPDALSKYIDATMDFQRRCVPSHIIGLLDEIERLKRAMGAALEVVARAEAERDEAINERGWSDKKYAITKNDAFNLETERDALQAANKDLKDWYDSAQADAKRYQSVRRGQKWSVIDGIGNVLRAETLDAAIDSAQTITPTSPPNPPHADSHSAASS